MTDSVLKERIIRTEKDMIDRIEIRKRISQIYIEESVSSIQNEGKDRDEA